MKSELDLMIDNVLDELAALRQLMKTEELTAEQRKSYTVLRKQRAELAKLLKHRYEEHKEPRQ